MIAGTPVGRLDAITAQFDQAAQNCVDHAGSTFAFAVPLGPFNRFGHDGMIGNPIKEEELGGAGQQRALDPLVEFLPRSIKCVLQNRLQRRPA